MLVRFMDLCEESCVKEEALLTGLDKRLWMVTWDDTFGNATGESLVVFVIISSRLLF